MERIKESVRIRGRKPRHKSSTARKREDVNEALRQAV
jgi:hypothetical protein